jgi:GTP-binding protein Era
MEENDYKPSEMADLDFSSIEDELLPAGHKSGLVAVIGRPNVGKSTLINTLMKQKIAIVSPRPQTTRTRQLGIITQPDYQIVFIDTPGLVKPRHKLDEFMVGVADESLHDAEIVLWLVDVSEEPGGGDREIAKILQTLPRESSVVLAMNKSDLLTPDKVVQRTETYQSLLPTANWILISALEGSGLQALVELLVQELPEGPRFYPIDQTTDAFIRDIAAELIREQIFVQMRDEIPYGALVRVEEFKERDNGVTYIQATIYVERENHKKILIGKKGAQLRQIGSAARKEIEELIEGKAFLELWVKVEPRWRHNEQALKKFGFDS